MNPNLGTIDRLLRIILGLILITLSATGVIGWWGWLGMIALITGLIKFCPLYRLLGLSSCKTCKK